MSKKVENNNDKACIYLYMDGCGPCKTITPVVDTMIACGVPIEKVKYDHKLEHFNRFGTPTLVFWDKSTNRALDRSLSTYHIHGLNAVKELGFDVPNLPEYIVAEMKKHGITK